MRYRTETHDRAIQGAIGCACLVAAVLIAVAFFGGCTVADTGEKKFDTCKALNIATASNATAAGASGIVCALLPTKVDRAECYAKRATIKAAADGLIGLAASIAKACGL